MKLPLSIYTISYMKIGYIYNELGEFKELELNFHDGTITYHEIKERKLAHEVEIMCLAERWY